MEQDIVYIEVAVDDTLFINTAQWLCNKRDEFLSFFFTQALTMHSSCLHDRIQWSTISVVLYNDGAVPLYLD